MSPSHSPLRRTSLKTHSPQNSINGIYELLINNGSSDPQHDANNRAKPTSTLAKLSLRSLLCLMLTVTLASFSVMHTTRQVLVSEITSVRSENLRRNDAPHCSIPQWTYPNCKAHLGSSSGLSTPEQWYDLRTKYEQVVGKDKSSLDPYWRDQDPTKQVTGFQVPIEIRTSPGKGRGVFLTEPVSEGTLIWDDRYTARFDECALREFFAAVGEEEACNAVMWGYVNDFKGDGLQFLLDLDEAVYINEAKDPDQINMVNFSPNNLFPQAGTANLTSVMEQRRKPGSFQAYAKSDLPAGTELLFDYADVHIYGKLYWYEKLCVMSRGIWGWMVMH